MISTALGTDLKLINKRREFFTEDPLLMMSMSTVFFVPELLGHFTGIPMSFRVTGGRLLVFEFAIGIVALTEKKTWKHWDNDDPTFLS